MMLCCGCVVVEESVRCCCVVGVLWVKRVLDDAVLWVCCG